MKETKSKKTRSRILLVLALGLVMVFMIQPTLAKYISKTSASSTATVAKWSIKVNGDEIAVSPEKTISFDLFSTGKEADTTTDETNVAAEKIAPGTGGSFALVIENTSDVDAMYSLSLQETNANNVPVEYSLDSVHFSDSLDGINTVQTEVALNRQSGSKTVTVYWRWAFDGDDSADTALGIAAQTAAPTVTVDASISVEQVD